LPTILLPIRFRRLLRARGTRRRFFRFFRLVRLVAVRCSGLCAGSRLLPPASTATSAATPLLRACRRSVRRRLWFDFRLRRVQLVRWGLRRRCYLRGSGFVRRRIVLLLAKAKPT